MNGIRNAMIASAACILFLACSAADPSGTSTQPGATATSAAPTRPIARVLVSKSTLDATGIAQWDTSESGEERAVLGRAVDGSIVAKLLVTKHEPDDGARLSTDYPADGTLLLRRDGSLDAERASERLRGWATALYADTAATRAATIARIAERGGAPAERPIMRPDETEAQWQACDNQCTANNQQCGEDCVIEEFLDPTAIPFCLAKCAVNDAECDAACPPVTPGPPTPPPCEKCCATNAEGACVECISLKEECP